MVPSPQETEAWSSLIDEFEKENPNIQIDLDAGPDSSDVAEKVYISDFNNIKRYDLVYMDIIWIPKFAKNGWLKNLSEILSENEKADLKEQFLENDVNSGYYDGKLYRIPLLSDVGVLYYRKDLLEQVGKKPPKTFEDLINISQKLQQEKKTENEIWGYLWQGHQYEGSAAMFTEILASYNGFWIDLETREVGLDRKEAIQAVEFLYNLIKKEISPGSVTIKQEKETQRQFSNGNTVFMRNWPHDWTQVNAADLLVRGKVGIIPMPSAKVKSGGCQGGWGFGISKFTKHQKEAWQAIEFFTSTAAQRKFALAGYMPSRRQLLTDPQFVKKYPYYPVLLKSAENSVLRPSIPEYTEASAILQKYLNATLKGTLDPQTAMNNAAKETRKLLGN